ncbi:hypothetical protein GCM10022286_24950 [Gryllotalpicola daejeonensis]|uniref:Uncharacterized protein n=1 Tax=Gryllotalpicola daejeonensis TaxID=993087 RepID=A0ABP7ZM21_9MICO
MWVDESRTVNVAMIPRPWELFDGVLRHEIEALGVSEADAIGRRLFELRQKEMSLAQEYAAKLTSEQLSTESRYEGDTSMSFPVITRSADSELVDDLMSQIQALDSRWRLDVAVYAEEGFDAVRAGAHKPRSWFRWFRRQ